MVGSDLLRCTSASHDAGAPSCRSFDLPLCRCLLTERDLQLRQRSARPKAWLRQKICQLANRPDAFEEKDGRNMAAPDLIVSRSERTQSGYVTEFTDRESPRAAERSTRRHSADVPKKRAKAS